MPRLFYVALAIIGAAIVARLAPSDAPDQVVRPPEVLTAAEVRDVLASADPRELRMLEELLFVADLQMARGNEDQPMRVVRSIQRRLAIPMVVPEADVRTVLADMRRVLAPLDRKKGYDVVQSMMEPAAEILPSTRECLGRIVLHPDPDLATAFLTRAYLSGEFHHRHNMRHQILEALVHGGLGARALVLVEEALRSTYAGGGPDSDFGLAVKVGREVFGPGFDAWYTSIRGQGYAWETFPLF